MMTKNLNPVFTVIFLSFFMTASAPKAASFEGAWQNLLAQFSECSSRHGYDPKIAKNIPENRLGNGELKWRECAYAEIEKIMVPASTAPGLFQRMVSEDKSMTKAILKGEMTRKQRKERLTVILNQIRDYETVQRKEQEQQLKEMNRRLREQEQQFKEQDRQFKAQMKRFERSRNPVARRAAFGFLR